MKASPSAGERFHEEFAGHERGVLISPLVLVQRSLMGSLGESPAARLLGARFEPRLVRHRRRSRLRLLVVASVRRSEEPDTYHSRTEVQEIQK